MAREVNAGLHFGAQAPNKLRVEEARRGAPVKKDSCQRHTLQGWGKNTIWTSHRSRQSSQRVARAPKQVFSPTMPPKKIK